MSVLVKGMEKPEHCGYCRFRYDGICHALQKTQYSMNECPLVVIDDAGLNDTISRQDAIDAIADYLSKTTYTSSISHLNTGALILAKVPSAQSERKRGEWRHYEGYLTCSECGTEYDDDIMTHCCDDVPKYCPNCGADMRGEQDVNVR